MCQNVLVGSVSFAAPGPKAMHNASTAQEVKIITPTAKDLEFRVRPALFSRCAFQPLKIRPASDRDGTTRTPCRPAPYRPSVIGGGTEPR